MEKYKLRMISFQILEFVFRCWKIRKIKILKPRNVLLNLNFIVTRKLSCSSCLKIILDIYKSLSFPLPGSLFDSLIVVRRNCNVWNVKLLTQLETMMSIGSVFLFLIHFLKRIHSSVFRSHSQLQSAS